MVRSDNEGGHASGLAFSERVELLLRADHVAAANDMLGIEGSTATVPNCQMQRTWRTRSLHLWREILLPANR
jgi:hypothetical protein